MSTEHEEIAAAARGDEAAFQGLVHRHQRAVLAYLHAMTGNRAMTEEMAQETFVIAFRGLRSFRGQSSVRTWLIGIAKNLAFKEIRRVTRTVELTDENAPAQTTSEGSASELRHDIDHALSRLAPLRRSIFVMRVLEGLDYAQISQLTGMPEGRLRLEVFRARQKLAAMLAPYLDKR